MSQINRGTMWRRREVEKWKKGGEREGEEREDMRKEGKEKGVEKNGERMQRVDKGGRS